MPVQSLGFKTRSVSPRRQLTIGLWASLLLSPLAAAESPEPPAESFDQCVVRLKDRAIRDGIAPQTADTVLSSVEHLDKVIELDRRQPEFTTTFADYLNRRVSDQRISKGRELLQEHRELLDRVTEKTGVPPAYLLAFWGLETNFGSYFGKMSVPSSLATLACDPRRSEFFSRQLVAALRIIEEGSIDPEQMEGSWAGAMGHVQFMPTVFLQYAVDGDNDGRRDLWHSVPDAMMSAGNFLQNLGWDGEYRWGREVLLPRGFDYSLADGRRMTLAQWRKLGITDVYRQPIANESIKASLVVPAGHQGPAFLAYHNFRVIMGWNRSEFYAIAVGHLADRIAGAGGLYNPPPENIPALSRSQILALQQALNDRGFGSGEPDGIMGPATRSAIRAFQASERMTADGFPGTEVLSRLGIGS